MFKSTIRVYDDPTQPPVIEEFSGTIGEYIQFRWGDGIPSADFMVFRGQPAVSTVCDLDDPASWCDTDGEFCITLASPPGDPVTAAWAVVAAVAAVVVVQALAPAIPAMNTNGRAQQSPNNSLEQRSNKPRVNQRVNDIFGDERCTFDLLSVPISEFVDNKEFETFYAGIGRGRYDILDFRDGTTPLTSIDGAAASVFGPHTSPNSGDAPTYTIGGGVTGRLMTAARINSVDGQSVEAPNEQAVSFVGATATTAGMITMPTNFNGGLATIFSPGDTLTLIDAWFAQPPVAPAVDYKARGVAGNYTVVSVTSNTIKLDVTGIANWAYADTFRASVWYSSFDVYGEGTSLRLTGPGLGWSEYKQAANIVNEKRLTVGPFVVLDGEVDVFRYNTVAVNGLYRDDGTVYPLTVDLELKIEQLDANGNPTGIFAAPTIITMSGSQRDTVAKTTNVNNPFPGFGTRHSMRRVTNRPSTDGQNVSDEIKWRDFFTFRDDVPTQFGDITTAYVRIRATDSALRVKERVANARVVRLIPQLGNDWSTPLAPLKDFASIASAIARDPKIGRLPASAFDEQVWELERDRLIAYFGDSSMVEVAHTFDDTNVTFEESVQLVASAAFCQAYRQGSVVRVLADLPQPTSTALFCHRNKHPGSDKRSRRFTTDKRRDGVELSYKSRATDAMETYTLGIDGSAPSNASEVEVHGIRTKKQAVIHARRRVNRLKYQRISVEFDALGEGRLLVPTSRIDVVNNTLHGTMDGEVVGQDGLVLKVSQPVSTGAGAHSVVLSRSDGGVEGIPVTAASGRELTLSRLPSDSVYSGHLKARTRFAFGPDGGEAMAIRVESVSPDSVDRVRVQGVNYSDGYFEGDLLPIA